MLTSYSFNYANNALVLANTVANIKLLIIQILQGKKLYQPQKRNHEKIMFFAFAKTTANVYSYYSCTRLTINDIENTIWNGCLIWNETKTVSIQLILTTSKPKVDKTGNTTPLNL